MTVRNPLAPSESDLEFPAADPKLLGMILRNRKVQAYLVVGVIIVAAAIIGTLFPRYPPNQQDLQNVLQPPSWAHLFGTDDLGRDIQSRLLVAIGVSLRACVQALLLSAFIGIPAGMTAGYVGGSVDNVLSRATDALMSVPSLLLALTVVGLLGPSLTNAMIAVGVAYAPRLFRVVRGVTIAVRNEDYIRSASLSGASVRWIVRRHVTPNIGGHILLHLALLVGFAILAESSLSFLGLGVSPPTPSLGGMLADGNRYIRVSPTFMMFPGIAITGLVLLVGAVANTVRNIIYGDE